MEFPFKNSFVYILAESFDRFCDEESPNGVSDSTPSSSVGTDGGQNVLENDVEYLQKALASVRAELASVAAEADAYKLQSKQADHRFKLLFNSSPVAHLRLDSAMRILDSNCCACDLLRIVPSQCREDHLTIKQFLSEDSVRVFEDAFTALKNGKPIDDEIRVQVNHSNAIFRETLIHLSELGAEEGEAYFLVSILDETEVSQLRRARDAEHTATQAKSDFLAMMSHEIRTPMNSIIGFSELFRDTNLSEEQSSYLEHIEGSAYVLLNLINDILDFSKIEAGAVEVKNQPFDLRAQFRRSVTEFLPLSIQKGFDIDLEVDALIPKKVNGDVYHLAQILRNLLSNAVKFTEKGKVTLSARHAGQEDGLLRVNILVEDTGIGIDSIAQLNLFQVFSQVDNSSTRQFGGTGLGLAISRRLARLMGGDIFVKSEPNRGSVFTVSLTFGCVEDEVERIQRMDTPTRAPFAPRLTGSDYKASFKGRHWRILLAEDDETNLLLFQTMLGRLGLSVDVARDGALALEMVQQNDYDLMFLDLQMPMMDGLEVALKIRQKKNITQPHIIAVTAKIVSDIKDKCFNAGMDGFISKPIRVDRLIESLEHYKEKEKA